MGLFDMFGGDKPTEKNIQKQVAKVKERYAQPEFRRAAMEKLLEWGTPEAIDGLLQRFTVVIQSPHWDEEEKRWLVEELAERGDVARAALARFLRTSNHIAMAAQALRRVTDEGGFTEEIAEALKARDPEDYRSVQGKQELVACLGEHADGGALEVLLPFLDDHGDDVRCTTIDVIEKHAFEPAYPRLIELVTEDMHSARVLRHAAGAIARLKVPIDPEKALAPAVIEDFVVRDGTLAANR